MERAAIRDDIETREEGIQKRRADIEYDIHYCSVMSMSESRRKSTSNPLKQEVCMFIQMYVFWAKIRFSR